MPLGKVLARDYLIEVETTTPTSYVEIKGLNSIGYSPDHNRADTTDFNDEGRTAGIITSRSTTLELEGFRMEDESGGDRDPGQARVEVLGNAFGPASLGHVRITSPGGEVIEFDATFSVQPFGGGNDDPAEWKATIEASGAIETT